ncbi:MAG: alpha/beta hydrolase [Actinomycetota bacterium]
MSALTLADGTTLALSGPERAPVLFLHGGAGTARRHWGGPMTRLPGRYRPFGIDLRGHGASTGEITGGLTQVVDDVLDVLRATSGDGGVHVVGFSMGGCAALKAALREPHHFRSLTLLGVHARLPAGVDAQSKQRFTEWATLEVDRLRGHHRDGRDWAGFLANLTALQNDVSDEELRLLEVPVLVVHGDRDEYVPVGCALHLASLLPNAELSVLPDARHLAHQDCPELFDVVLHRFLDGVERSVSPSVMSTPPPANPQGVQR